MKRLLKTFYRLLVMFGVDPLKTLRALRGLPAYFRDLRLLKTQLHASTPDFPLGRPWPCLDDRFDNSGTASGHYFHQDLLVARRIHLNTPRLHVDVGSSIAGFVAHVAAFRAIEVLDIRPLPNTIPNVTFRQLDLMAPVPPSLRAYCDSLSCLHAMEHFGLGRYGDPVNSAGHLLGLANLYDILQPNGRLYFSVPIGPQRIEFNAHRVFAVRYLLQCFEGKYRLDRFSFVDDRGDLHEDVALSEAAIADNCGCTYGCGILELTKL